MKISSGITCLIVHGIILQWPSIITKILNWIFLAPCSCNPRGVLTFDTLVCHWPWTKVTYNFTFRLPSIHTRQTSIKFRMQQQGLCVKLRNLTTSILFFTLYWLPVTHCIQYKISTVLEVTGVKNELKTLSAILQLQWQSCLRYRKTCTEVIGAGCRQCYRHRQRISKRIATDTETDSAVTRHRNSAITTHRETDSAVTTQKLQ